MTDLIKEDVLQTIGLSLNESKVYVNLLRIGPCAAGKVCEEAKIHRPNVYDALERLVAKGLVSTFERQKVTIFEAASPERLLNIHEEKTAKLRMILPQLLLDKQLAVKTKAVVYEGVTALRQHFFEWLEVDGPIRAWGIPSNAPEVVKQFIKIFHARRIQKKIWMHHLYNENAKERINFLNTLPYTAAAYLPEKYNSPVSTNVCGNIISFFFFEEPITIVKIEHAGLAEAYKKYFDFMFEQAKQQNNRSKTTEALTTTRI